MGKGAAGRNPMRPLDNELRSEADHELWSEAYQEGLASLKISH